MPAPSAVRPVEAMLAKEIYRGLEMFFEAPPSHCDFVQACRAAGLSVPRGVVRESLWVMASGVVEVPPA